MSREQRGEISPQPDHRTASRRSSQPWSSRSAGSGPSRWWLRASTRSSATTSLRPPRPSGDSLLCPRGNWCRCCWSAAPSPPACARRSSVKGELAGDRPVRWLLLAYLIPLLDVLRALGMPIQYTFFEPLLLTGISGGDGRLGSRLARRPGLDALASFARVGREWATPGSRRGLSSDAVGRHLAADGGGGRMVVPAGLPSVRRIPARLSRFRPFRLPRRQHVGRPGLPAGDTQPAARSGTISIPAWPCSRRCGDCGRTPSCSSCCRLSAWRRRPVGISRSHGCGA